MKGGFAVLVPAGMAHNFINTGSMPLKLFTIYSPANHADGVYRRRTVAALAG